MTHDDDMTAKQLIVMRHAKAGELPGGPDEERALRGRGRHDAAAAGGWLRHRGFVPDRVICSPARRARQTWHYASAELPGGVAASNDPRLYHADAAELLGIIAGTAAEVGTLMYVGHNPAAAELAAGLTGQELSFPTAAIAVIAMPAQWADAAEGTGELTAHWVPAHS